jgi:predicted nucleic acid-binding OB-fold protein
MIRKNGNGRYKTAYDWLDDDTLREKLSQAIDNKEMYLEKAERLTLRIFDMENLLNARKKIAEDVLNARKKIADDKK